MTLPPEIPEPPDFEAIAGWIGGLALVLASIVGSIWLAIKRVARLAETMPEERPTKIVTADSVAMRALDGQLSVLNQTMTENNALLRQLVSQGEGAVRRAAAAEQLADEARQEADINERIKQQLAEQLALFERALKRPPPPKPRQRKPAPPRQP